MPDTKLVSPLLDGFTLGNPMSNHSGICCCPAMKDHSDNKYIVKVIAVPASQTQLDALLVTGAYKDPAAALDYFREQADNLAIEAELLQKLSALEGFVSYRGWQVTPMKKNRLGYHVYLVSDYRRSLEKFIRRHPVTHLEAVQLGIDICSALALCRRAGYLYIDLKPTNIFVDEDNEYKIGDLGFAAMDSLKYTSMPEKYCSAYTAPEMQDPLNTLNETVDTYALGMILYRIFNDGKLPEYPRDPAKELAAPVRADEQMTGIILKACSVNPEDRWKDPTEMGQALAAYLQSNPIDDAPVSPDAPAENPQAAAQDTVRFTPGMITDPVQDAAEPSDLEKTILAPVSFQAAAEAAEAAPEVPDTVTAEAPAEEAAPESASQPEEIQPEVVPEVSGQDGKAEAIPADEEAFDIDSELSEVNSLLSAPAAEPKKAVATIPAPADIMQPKKRKVKKLLMTLLVIALLAAAVFCTFCYYQFIYLQNIDGLSISGTQDDMVVTVRSEIDPAKLSVVCMDAFGNTKREPLVDGKATFTELLPNSLYNVFVEMSGFHKLTGSWTEVFTTESQTEVVSIAAVTGQEDGSVLLTLTVHGHEPDLWTATCTADGEPTVTESFSGHSATVTGLTVGKLYTITMSTDEELDLIGEKSILFTASNVISAGNLAVISRLNGELTVCWDTPENFEVENWAVRCYGEDYDETQAVTGTLAIFTGTDNTKAYTVEVTAAGMTQPTRTSVSANPITITSLTVDDSTDQELTVKWDYDGAAPAEGWLLLYTMDGSEISNVLKCTEPSVLISPRVPGANYAFTVQTVEGTTVFNGTQSYQCPSGGSFDGHAVSASQISVKLIPTPEEREWLAENIDTSLCTDTFDIGQKISMAIHSDVSFYLEHEDLNILFVVRDSNNKVIPNLIEQIKSDWNDLWFDGDYHYAELNVPNAPIEAGSYTVDVYFNGALAISAKINIK